MEIKSKFNCDLCNYACTYKSEFNKHLKSAKHKRGGAPVNHDCNLCNYSSSSPWNLKMHIVNIHMTKEEKKELQYYCEICDCLCFSQLYYNTHMDSKEHNAKIDKVSLSEDLQTKKINNNIKIYLDNKINTMKNDIISELKKYIDLSLKK
jgi:hypothetical protein